MKRAEAFDSDSALRVERDSALRDYSMSCAYTYQIAADMRGGPRAYPPRPLVVSEDYRSLAMHDVGSCGGTEHGSSPCGGAENEDPLESFEHAYKSFYTRHDGEKARVGHPAFPLISLLPKVGYLRGLGPLAGPGHGPAPSVRAEREFLLASFEAVMKSVGGAPSADASATDVPPDAPGCGLSRPVTSPFTPSYGRPGMRVARQGMNTALRNVVVRGVVLALAVGSAAGAPPPGPTRGLMPALSLQGISTPTPPLPDLIVSEPSPDVKSLVGIPTTPLPHPSPAAPGEPSSEDPPLLVTLWQGAVKSATLVKVVEVVFIIAAWERLPADWRDFLSKAAMDVHGWLVNLFSLESLHPWTALLFGAVVTALVFWMQMPAVPSDFLRKAADALLAEHGV